MKPRQPDRLISYFLLQKKNLFLVTLTGILYNIGMTAGPYFEGRLSQCLYDIMGGRKTWTNMLRLAAVYVAVLLVVQGARALKRFYVRRFANETGRSMRSTLYAGIVHSPRATLEQQQLGAVMTKAVGDVDACVEGMRKFTTEVFDTGVVLVAYGVLLCIYDVRLAVLSCLLIPCAYLLAGRCKGVVTRYNEAYKESAGRLNQTTMDLVQNSLTYRVFGQSGRRADAYEERLSAYEVAAVRANVWESALQPLYHLVVMGGSVLIFYLGGRNVLGTGWTAWDIGAFTTFFSCFAKLALKSSKAAKLFNSVQKAEVSWKRIKPMLHPATENDPPETCPTEALRFAGVGVDFEGCEPLLQNLDFSLQKGQIIGITGEVASGKSAVGKLFVGEAVYTGSVTLDGTELNGLTLAQRTARVTYLGHEPELMSTTIAENIQLGEGANVAEPLRLTCMDKEVAAMPDGVQTIVGNGGARLSGGQQARLALARCLAHCKGVLVLDDPFSAVDKSTERQIFENLQPMLKTRITLLISHRLELFPRLDGVLYLHDSTASFGTHETLMHTQPGYARLAAAQEGGRHE